MAMEGKAALAMWWDMAAEMRTEFEHWHTHEHWPERLALPGFRRATRWQDEEGEGFFVMYELDDAASLTSPEYLACLNAPSPWSARMMPHHRNMDRNPARAVASRGGVVAGHLMTVRISAEPDRMAELSGRVADLAGEWAVQPGAVGMHALQTAAESIVSTTESRIRGADNAADFIVLAAAYEPAALRDLAEGALSGKSLVRWGARADPVVRMHRLRASMHVGEMTDT
jgi:hypothetical protein